MVAPIVGIVVNGTFEVDLERQSEFVAIIREHLARTRSVTAGCIYYSVAIDVENPRLLHLIEGWSNREALDRHLASEDLAIVRSAFSKVGLQNYQTFIFTVSEQRPYLSTAQS